MYLLDGRLLLRISNKLDHLVLQAVLKHRISDPIHLFVLSTGLYNARDNWRARNESTYLIILIQILNAFTLILDLNRHNWSRNILKNISLRLKIGWQEQFVKILRTVL